MDDITEDEVARLARKQAPSRVAKPAPLEHEPPEADLPEHEDPE